MGSPRCSARTGYTYTARTLTRVLARCVSEPVSERSRGRPRFYFTRIIIPLEIAR